MSNAAISGAWQQKTGSTGERLVLIVMADAANKDTGECWLAQGTIAKRAQITDRQVRRHLRQLEKRGLIVNVGRRRRALCYRVETGHPRPLSNRTPTSGDGRAHRTRASGVKPDMQGRDNGHQRPTNPGEPESSTQGRSAEAATDAPPTLLSEEKIELAAEQVRTCLRRKLPTAVMALGIAHGFGRNTLGATIAREFEHARPAIVAAFDHAAEYANGDGWAYAYAVLNGKITPGPATDHRFEAERYHDIHCEGELDACYPCCLNYGLPLPDAEPVEVAS